MFSGFTEVTSFFRVHGGDILSSPTPTSSWTKPICRRLSTLPRIPPVLTGSGAACLGPGGLVVVPQPRGLRMERGS